MSRKWALRVRWAVQVVLVCLLSGLGTGDAGSLNLADPAQRRLREKMGFTDLDPLRDGFLMSQLLNLDYAMADISLATKEQVDFLLTPALLVQEAVSDDVVLTYPQE